MTSGPALTLKALIEAENGHSFILKTAVTTIKMINLAAVGQVGNLRPIVNRPSPSG